MDSEHSNTQTSSEKDDYTKDEMENLSLGEEEEMCESTDNQLYINEDNISQQLTEKGFEKLSIDDAYETGMKVRQSIDVREGSEDNIPLQCNEADVTENDMDRRGNLQEGLVENANCHVTPDTGNQNDSSTGDVKSYTLLITGEFDEDPEDSLHSYDGHFIVIEGVSTESTTDDFDDMTPSKIEHDDHLCHQGSHLSEIDRTKTRSDEENSLDKQNLDETCCVNSDYVTPHLSCGEITAQSVYSNSSESDEREEQVNDNVITRELQYHPVCHLPDNYHVGDLVSQPDKYDLQPDHKDSVVIIEDGGDTQEKEDVETSSVYSVRSVPELSDDCTANEVDSVLSSVNENAQPCHVDDESNNMLSATVKSMPADEGTPSDLCQVGVKHDEILFDNNCDEMQSDRSLSFSIHKETLPEHGSPVQVKVNQAMSDIHEGNKDEDKDSQANGLDILNPNVASENEMQLEDFEIVSKEVGLPFTQHVQHVHVMLLSKGEDVNSQLGGEQILMLHLKNKDKKNLKAFLRGSAWGPSHPIRGCLWKQTCEHLHKAKGNVYEEFEQELFMHGRDQDVQLPSFVDFDNLTSYHLTQSGVHMVERNLAVIHNTNPDIIYCPALYPMVSLFLHYMESSDVYNCAYELLRAKEPYIMQTKVAVEASKAVLRDLTKKFAKSAYVYLVRNSSNIDLVFDSWIWWIFSDLPFPYLVRVIDCFLLEGHKVLFRIAIAILILYHKYSVKHAVSLSNNVVDSIRQFCSDMPFSVRKLLKRSFGIRGLTRKEIKKLQVKHEMLLKSRNLLNHEMVKSMSTHSMGLQHSKSFSGPVTLQEESSILKPDMHHTRRCRSVGMIIFPNECFNSLIATIDDLYTIWSWLPPRYAVCQPELLYTSEEHGTSLMTLFSRVENYQPTLLFIKTTDDEVFGAFCSTYWRERRRSTKNVSYFGTGETFLFTLAPEKKKYEWVGLTQDDIPNTANMFMAGDTSILTVGGGNGEAIQLDANLLHCRSERCDTFANQPLCSYEDFTCKVVEVYGFQ